MEKDFWIHLGNILMHVYSNSSDCVLSGRLRLIYMQTLVHYIASCESNHI